jgi:hypothetical protein
MPFDVTLSSEVRHGLSVYPVPGVAALGATAFVTDRFGGVSTGPYRVTQLGSPRW